MNRAETDSKPQNIKSSRGYIASAKRSELKDGKVRWYWTIRNRRRGREGEWKLGWFDSRKAAERQFLRWCHHRNDEEKSLKPRNITLIRVLELYKDAVESMVGKRPNTRSNRVYGALKLMEFVNLTDDRLLASEFDSYHFEQYLVWLVETPMKNRSGHYSPQSVQNFLRGARVALRWAVDIGYITSAPKEPHYRVDISHKRYLSTAEVHRTIQSSDASTGLLLRLILETGMRFSEAVTVRLQDIVRGEGDYREVIIQRRPGLVPKTHESSRSIPITPSLFDSLFQKATSDKDAQVFRTPWKNVHAYWNYNLKRAQKQADVLSFSFHDVRRLVAIKLRESTTEIGIYSKLMGHGPKTGIRHYTEATPKAKAKLMSTLVESLYDGTD